MYSRGVSAQPRECGGEMGSTSDGLWTMTEEVLYVDAGGREDLQFEKFSG